MQREDPSVKWLWLPGDVCDPQSGRGRRTYGDLAEPQNFEALLQLVHRLARDDIVDAPA